MRRLGKLSGSSFKIAARARPFCHRKNCIRRAAVSQPGILAVLGARIQVLSLLAVSEITFGVCCAVGDNPTSFSASDAFPFDGSDELDALNCNNRAMPETGTIHLGRGRFEVNQIHDGGSGYRQHPWRAVDATSGR